MKKWIMAGLAALTVAGCSTHPTNLKPVKDKYTFQALSISLPLTDSRMLNAQPPSLEEIEALFKNPNAEIIEFPVVYAGVGETVTNAQTEVYEANVDYEIIDDELIYHKDEIDIGKKSIFSVYEILGDGSVNCAFDILHRQLIGTESFQPEEGIEVEIPHLGGHGLESKLTLPPDTWHRMGGPIKEREDGTKMHEIIYFRVLPPK